MKAQRRRGQAATGPATIGYLHWGAPLAASAADWPGGADHGALLDALGQVAPRVEPDPPAGCYLDLGDRPSGVARETALAEWGAAILASVLVAGLVAGAAEAVRAWPPLTPAVRVVFGALILGFSAAGVYSQARYQLGGAQPGDAGADPGGAPGAGASVLRRP